MSLLLDAGMPVEAVQLLHGGGDVGAQLCAADQVAVISFTGSAATGAAVARAAGPKRLVLELGGNAATIVCEDADVQAAARICARTGYSNSGQSCISVQRVYVQRDRFGGIHSTRSRPRWRAAHRRPARRRDGRRVDGRRRSGRAGGPLDRGGGRRRRRGHARRDPRRRRHAPDRGGGSPGHCVVVVHEVFGALVAVLPYGAFGEVSRRCNASRFGLQAGLFTRDIGRSSPPGGTWRSAGSWSTARPTSGWTMCLRRGEGLGLRAGVAALDDRRLHRGQDAAARECFRRGQRVRRGGRMSELASESVSTVRPRMRTPPSARCLIRHRRAALAAQLESYGVEYVFGTCGHTNIALLDALSRTGIRFVIARHEQAAAHAADGYARAPGGRRVLLHVGPGHDERGHRRGHRRARLGTAGRHQRRRAQLLRGRHPHQEVNLHADADQTAIYRPFIKRAWHVHGPRTCRGSPSARSGPPTSGRPGAVLVNVPMDIFSRPGRRRLSLPGYPLPADTAAAGAGAPTARRASPRC